jgi:hypothetical protein
MYQKINNPDGSTSTTMIRRKEDKDGGAMNAFIPMSAANTDYQAYLEWVDEGNTAEEAD